MKKIAIVTAPYFLTELHRDWAEAWLSSVQSKYELNVIAIINGVREGSDDLDWIKRSFNYSELNDQNIVARAWNKGIKKGFEDGADYVIVSNLDLILHPRSIDNLVNCALEHPETEIWSATPWLSYESLNYAKISASTGTNVWWSFALLNKRVFDAVGGFDEKFVPAYLEDADFSLRCRLLGVKGGNTESALFFHRERGTISGLLECPPADTDNNLKMMLQIRQQITANDKLYNEKWGGAPMKEQFKTPYNA